MGTDGARHAHAVGAIERGGQRGHGARHRPNPATSIRRLCPPLYGAGKVK